MKIPGYVFLMLVLLGFLAGIATAADYQSMTNEELSVIRNTLQNATQEERDAFHSEWSGRLEQMSPEEMASYSSAGPGKGNGLQDGSGDGEGSGNGSGGGNGNGNGSGGGNGNRGGGGSGRS